MTKKELIDSIIEKEWVMFHNVNGDERTDCQEDRRQFEIMRRAQYEAWSQETVECFYQDISSAEAKGRNISREKYIRMMKYSDPKGYAAFEAELPELSEKQQGLVKELWNKYYEQTVRMRDKYPMIAFSGRQTSADENETWASIETYQTSEMMTYSEQTLEALLRHLKALESQGIDLVFKIQENTIIGLGFKSMDQAEQYFMNRYVKIEQRYGCTNCCGPNE